MSSGSDSVSISSDLASRDQTLSEAEAESEADEYKIGNEISNPIREESDYEIDKNAPQTTDSLLAYELNKLSFHERESINEEIHGINIDKKYIEETGVFNETPELRTKSIGAMQTELDRLCSTEGGAEGSAFAFKKAQELYGPAPDACYFNKNDFRLMFLRCERFNCKKAAKRLCLYANLMLERFGEFALGREPQLSDLDDDEVAIVKEGYSVLFPGRDRAGRRIYIHFAGKYNLSDRSRERIPFYILSHMLRNDIESQRRGIVCVMWFHNVRSLIVADLLARGRAQDRLVQSIPIRFGAGHFCFPSTQSSASFFHLVNKLTLQIRPHIRVHTGKITYSLTADVLRPRDGCIS